MPYTFALVGNPNCGKTTMFNEMTGSTQYVGNWPGVTVEKKEGRVKKFKENIKIVDLPGIYSLSPYSLEEIIARDYIIEEKPDVVINIVDASNIERNLYLTLQLKELGTPVVVALNMMDVVASRGDIIDIKKLESFLGMPVVPTSANKGTGVREVVEKALAVAEALPVQKEKQTEMVYDDSINKSLDVIEELAAKATSDKGYNPRWAALKLLENDEKVMEKLKLDQSLMSRIGSLRDELENKFDIDIETIIADARYQYISKIISKAVKKKLASGELTVSDKIDKVVTNRILAIPIFLAIMFLVFRITFGTLGSYGVDFVDGFINETLSSAVESWLLAAGGADWLVELIVGGIIGGLGSVLAFIPQIILLFFFLSLLEDSGYMARAAFVMDRMLRKLGLSGKSFIPMLMGFGCTVPAAMAARTLENEKDRKLTIMLTPFMSCGARLPVYALFAAAFFFKNQTIVIFSIYLLGIVVAILSGILLKNTLFKGDVAPFVMELPPYRIPTLKGLAIHMWDRIKGFLKKAGTIIFTASVLIWFCQSFSLSLKMVEDPADSIFGTIGKAIAPIFSPLGFGDWKSSMALLTGLVAKEVVVSTLGILNGVGEEAANITTAIQSYFTPLKAYSFMVFTLLYMPCVAAFAAIKRELNSWKLALFSAGYQMGVAWIAAFLVYQVGRLLGFA
ncbi:MAG TPA: ferrous iron transport protein B [Clostridiaceae bacterium]|nr:ferrous iron transport protein B [Clostridiaceae bacterium]